MNALRVAFIALVACLSVGCQKRGSIAQEYPPEVTALATEGGEGLPYFVGKDLRPVWQVKTLEPRKLNAFQMTDQFGHAITHEELKGKTVAISFFFTQCPGICPLTTKNLKAVQEKFLKDDRFLLLSFSITPEYDTPDRLNAYAQANGIDSHRWRLVTGDRKKIYQLARESFGADTYSAREDSIKKLKVEDFLHSESVYLLDHELKLRGVYGGKKMGSVMELMRDAEVLLL